MELKNIKRDCEGFLDNFYCNIKNTMVFENQCVDCDKYKKRITKVKA